jgi:hypothetical protein
MANGLSLSATGVSYTNDLNVRKFLSLVAAHTMWP